MNREVLSRFDWMSVGEGVGVGTREAVQYAGYESHELNMMFHLNMWNESRTIWKME